MTGLSVKHLVGIKELSKEDIYLIFKMSSHMKKYLQGQIINHTNINILLCICPMKIVY